MFNAFVSCFLLFSVLCCFADSRKAHFTVEFVPMHPKETSDDIVKCFDYEHQRLAKTLIRVIREDTGLDDLLGYQHITFSHDEHHEGVDMTFACPEDQRSCEGQEWCRILCVDRIVHLRHASVDALSHDIKEKLVLELKNHGKNLESRVSCLC